MQCVEVPVRRHAVGMLGQPSAHVLRRAQPAVVVIDDHVEALARRQPHPVESGAGDAAEPAADSGSLEELRMHIRCAVPALSSALDLAASDGAPKRLPAEPSRVELVRRSEAAEFADRVHQGGHPSRMSSGPGRYHQSPNLGDTELVTPPVQE